MSGNALTNPSSAKIEQQRKILEELEKRKKQLNQGGQPTSSSAVSVQNTLVSLEDPIRLRVVMSLGLGPYISYVATFSTIFAPHIYQIIIKRLSYFITAQRQ